MRKITTLFFLFVFSSLNTYAQFNNVDIETGVSVNISNMTLSNLGRIMGYGFKIDNRINFSDTRWVLKNSIGITAYGDRQVVRKGSYWVETVSTAKATDYHYMLDAMAEYNFFDFSANFFDEDNRWTPYMGAGFNFIYRHTGDYPDKTKPTRPKSDAGYITLKGSLGIKYKINKRLTLTAEGFGEWDFSDKLDNDDFRTNNGEEIKNKEWYQHDHSHHFSIGVIYLFEKSGRRKGRSLYPWSPLYK